MNNNILEIINISKQFDGDIVLKDISLNIKEGEFITLLGPSGCGKSTTLRIIGGFDTPSSGQILFDGKNLVQIPIDKRPFNMIFQSYALFPHLNVFENIAFGLKIKKTKNEIIEKEVLKQIRQVGLKGFETKKISELSGGQQQRVAIARALIMKPKVLLLDEPMAALDVKLRKTMQAELKRLQQEIGITFIMVTHDQEEALTISDRIVVIDNGIIKQVGTPQEIYNEPEDAWVANFVGISNIIKDGVFLRDHKIKIDGKTFDCADTNFGINEKNIDICIRPEDILIKNDLGAGFFDGKIIENIFKGTYWELKIKTTKSRIWIIQTTDEYQIGQKVSIYWDYKNVHVMWKEVEL